MFPVTITGLSIETRKFAAIDALVSDMRVGHGGLRGHAETTGYAFAAPIGFGPFSLPAEQAVTVRKDVGSTDTRVGNVGNEVLAAMG